MAGGGCKVRAWAIWSGRIASAMTSSPSVDHHGHVNKHQSPSPQKCASCFFHVFINHKARNTHLCVQKSPKMAVTRSQAKRSAARKAARKRSASPLGLTPLKQAKASKKGPDASQIYTPRDQSDASSVEEGLEWQRQFRRDKDLDSKLNGVGCGFYTLGGPWVPSQYPSPSEMMFEISTGMDKVSGCIKLRGPRNYWPDYQYKDLRDACFIVPAAHISKSVVVSLHIALSFHQLLLIQI